jgi:transcriptional regulator with XRE-family HTH domain
MSLFSDNIRQLRVKKVSLRKTGSKSLITRGRYVKYEDGSSEPPYDILKRMSYYFHVSIDILLSVDVQNSY